MSTEEILLTEFRGLDQTIRERSQHQHHLMVASLVACSTVIGVALGQEAYPEVLLITPILSSVLGLMWVDHEMRKTEIWNYIAWDLIPELVGLVKRPVLRWRAYLYLPDAKRPRVIFGGDPRGLRRLAYVTGSLGPFVIPGIAGLVLLVVKRHDPVGVALALVGLTAVAAYLAIYRMARRRLTGRPKYSNEQIQRLGLEEVLKAHATRRIAEPLGGAAEDGHPRPA